MTEISIPPIITSLKFVPWSSKKTNVSCHCRILRPHSSGYNIVQPVEGQRTFRRIITLPSSALKRNPGKKPASSYILFGLFLNLEDEGDMLLRNVG
jgi:hypothetical protein